MMHHLTGPPSATATLQTAVYTELELIGASINS